MKAEFEEGRESADLPAEKRVDLEARVAVCDVEGVSALGGMSKRDALRLITRRREKDAGTTERKALRTADARRLKRDLLDLFAGEASSDVAKNRVLLSAPSLDRKVLRNRLELWTKGKEISDALKRTGKLEKLRSALRRLSFAQGKATMSPTLQFFDSRKEMLGVVHQMLTEFSDPAVESFFQGIDPRDVHGSLAALEELGALKIEDAEAAISDAELSINDTLRRGVRDRERAISTIEAKVEEIVSSLGFNWEEEEALKRAALGVSSLPFEFDRAATRRLIEDWRMRKEQELAARTEKAERNLRQRVGMVNDAVEKAVLLDQMLAIASATEKYSLTIPEIGQAGIGFVGGRNPFLARDHLDHGSPSSPQPVSYSVGKPSSIRLLGAKPRNAVMLTGANSGGKTTLLNTLAAIHVLTLLGLPVPAEKAETAPMPIYLFRKRAARKTGSLEHVLKSIIPVLAERQRKLVLIDELEALTEPGAAGRIIASIVNRAAATSSLFLLVTHLAKETLPHVKFPVRVDGIEASGLDEKGDLVVDRQPRFAHIGSSTPKLIIMKLSKSSRKEAVRALYDEVLSSLEGEAGAPVQAPIAFPWAADEPAE